MVLYIGEIAHPGTFFGGDNGEWAFKGTMFTPFFM
jgi:hypothetical protein